MQVPRSLDELVLTLGTFGAAIGLGKLLRSKEHISWRAIGGRALEGATLAMCAGVALLVYPEAPRFAMLGVGGLLASLGVSGIRSVITKVRASK